MKKKYIKNSPFLRITCEVMTLCLCICFSIKKHKCHNGTFLGLQCPFCSFYGTRTFFLLYQCQLGVSFVNRELLKLFFKSLIYTYSAYKIFCSSFQHVLINFFFGEGGGHDLIILYFYK